MSCAALPVSGRVSSPYGWRWLNGKSDLHTGIDVGAPEGTPVFAMLPGRVVGAWPTGTLSGYGNVIVLEHEPRALYSLYAHLRDMGVKPGDVVTQGAQIGHVGRTAGTPAEPSKLFDVSGAHLHFEFLNAWPPRGRDLDRLDPATVLGALGIIVPHEGPLQLACGGAPSRLRPTTVLAGSGALVLLLLVWAVSHKQQRRTSLPA